MNYPGPRFFLRVEGFALLVFSCVLFHRTGASWERFALWFLAPDLGIAAYVLGMQAGARCYNLLHTYTVPFALWIFAHAAHHPYLGTVCLIWGAHIGFDRLVGYGLKYDDAFKRTHLQKV